MTLTMNNAKVLASRRLFDIYLAELRCALLQQRRQPLGAIFTLLFPLLFYLFFAVIFTENLLAVAIEGIPAGIYLLAVCGVFAAVTVALQGFGLALAIERTQGWLRLRQAVPAPVAVYFASRLTLALLCGVALTLALLASAVLLTDSTLTVASALRLGAVLALGVLPFAALALALGHLVAPGSAAAVLQGAYYLLLLPLLLGPGNLASLPVGLLRVIEQLPSYHLMQLALGSVGVGQAPWWPSLSLAALGLAAFAVALWGYRRVEG